MKLKKNIFWMLFLLFISQINAQNIEVISSKTLYEKILKSDKPSIVQFWIPNCSGYETTLKQYDSLENLYHDKIDFYFLGITNLDSLIKARLLKANYTHKIYMVDSNEDKNINQRMKTFSLNFCNLLATKKKEFITLSLDKNDKIIYKGRKAVIINSIVKKVLR